MYVSIRICLFLCICKKKPRNPLSCLLVQYHKTAKSVNSIKVQTTEASAEQDLSTYRKVAWQCLAHHIKPLTQYSNILLTPMQPLTPMLMPSLLPVSMPTPGRMLQPFLYIHIGELKVIPFSHFFITGGTITKFNIWIHIRIPWEVMSTLTSVEHNFDIMDPLAISPVLWFNLKPVNYWIFLFVYDTYRRMILFKIRAPFISHIILPYRFIKTFMRVCWVGVHFIWK